MHPILLTTPFFTLYTFGVLLAAAYLSALGWVVRGARRTGLDPDVMTSLGFSAIVGALVGAKLMYIVRDPSGISDLRSVLTSAGDFYGGFIGALVACAIFFRRHREVPVWRAS